MHKNLSKNRCKLSKFGYEIKRKNENWLKGWNKILKN